MRGARWLWGVRILGLLLLVAFLLMLLHVRRKAEQLRDAGERGLERRPPATTWTPRTAGLPEPRRPGEPARESGAPGASGASGPQPSGPTGAIPENAIR